MTLIGKTNNINRLMRNLIFLLMLLLLGCSQQPAKTPDSMDTL